MKLLVLDSSGLVASVALIEDDRLIAEYTTGNKLTHSQTLLPMLDEVIHRTLFDIEDIDAIAVAMGPGSFTGLRIGAATAKGLGLALNKPIVPVPTVDGLAYQLFGSSSIICPMMDARRKQVYTGFYRFHGAEMSVLKEQCAQSVEDTLSQLKEYGEPVIFLGDGVPVYENEIKDAMGNLAIFAPVHANRQRAGAVGALAKVYFDKGIYQSADEFAPEYLRKSQAEREREEKINGKRESNR
ncbi:tRNA (adenosine(37)-N6)-threonylcarbamoyltransferase complex dimerization subunit type 1 TsaB [Anaerostipes faecalis]|uniref:tRNA (adenosine(37)-N6)-threonylcarbamoyltransferase complex dimerization subunit type 1 TsaB n=1 Tax=Anaerostipes faecalis TaxID=2738446 RepID=UPI001C1DF365|nr:tRNA (adenosine(37)-N6)-threonylcarbamoyltransferase complex dimerization subunit type 1 TsaB [Anaerostipes faecalis]